MKKPFSRLHTRLGTFRQLEIFMTFAETGSINKTAEKLHLAQPSVSIQLKKLADHLDVPLIESIGKKRYLTEQGKALYQSSLEIFDSVSRLESRLSSLAGMQAGTLKMSVVTTAKYFFPHLLGPFFKKYPNIDVQFNIGNRGSIVDRLKENKDDFYVFSFPPDHMDIETIKFLSNPLVVVAPIDHPKVNEPSVPFADLMQETFIMRENGSGTRKAIENHMSQHHIELPEKMVIESNEAIKHSVMAGLGLSILSVHTLAQERNTQLAVLDVAGFPINHHWYIVYLKDKQLSDIARTFLHFIEDEGREICRQLLLDSPASAHLDL